AEEDVTVYFYSPTCIHCQRTTPVLVPLAEEMGVDIKKMNLLEFEDEWDTYDIEGTPTLIHFSDGEEKDRMRGEQSEEEFCKFLDDNVQSCIIELASCHDNQYAFCMVLLFVYSFSSYII